ncbi:MAG: hypothetical protein KF727_11815 [Microbacteriaceae bacterium]|nr:hypothetical protein [Microbacteriaceae bacterium]
MTDAVIVTWDGGGNLPPALGIARELVRRGGRVRVLGHRVQRSAVEAAGFDFTAFERGRDYVSAEPRGTVDGVLGLVALFADRGIAADARALLSAEPADVVIVDCLLWGALDELGADPVPMVNLVHSVSAYFERNAAGPVGMLARLRGVSARKAAARASRTLVTTRADFEPPGKARPGAQHTGFVWQGDPVEAVPTPRPRVLVSFSTTTFPGQARTLQRVLDALADSDLDVVVTSGAVPPDELRAPGNARVVQYADHAEILATASLVVCHGGHSTTARALTAGVPVLVMPMHPLMDQPDIGRAVQRLGVGAALSKSASPARIRDAVLGLLGDDAVRAAAARMGAQARERDGASVAADAIEELVRAPQS